MNDFNKKATIIFMTMGIIFIICLITMNILMSYNESTVYTSDNPDYHLEVRVNTEKDGYEIYYYSLEESKVLCEVPFKDTKFYPSNFEYTKLIEEKNLLGEVRYKMTLFFIVGD